MYVCLCSGITEKQIKTIVQKKGITRLRDLNRELGACNQCGKCAKESKRIMHAG